MNHVLVDARDIAYPPWVNAAEAFSLSVLGELGFRDWELSIVFCSDAFIRDLNREYRAKDEPTDVLSFEMGEAVEREGGHVFLAGDIVISLPALERNAAEFSVDPEEELKRLIIHGILHLSGQDHATNDSGEPMLRAQEAILGRLAQVRIR